MKEINILEVFMHGIESRQENIIKTVNIDTVRHKIGLVNILKSFVPDFKIDTNNREIINILFNYFIGNEMFCMENNISLGKGILLCGGIGCGKTVLMNALKAYTGTINKVNSFQWYNSIEVIDNVTTSGVDYLNRFNENLQGNKPNPITCYIDDIASKNENVKNFGTQISVIEQLISIRYNIFTKHRKLTHFSTNILPSKLNEYYDMRIIDRLNEMCNIIALPGDSRRK